MRIFQFPLVRLFGAFTIGILWAFHFPFELPYHYLLIAAFLLLLSNLLVSKRWINLGFYPFFFLLGTLLLRNSLPSRPILNEQNCSCKVIKIRSQKSRLIYWMKCQADNGQSFICELNWKDRNIAPVIGERLRINLDLKPIYQNQKAGSFDYAGYLKKKGILSSAYIKNAKKSGYTTIEVPNRLNDRWRKKWISLFQSNLSERAAILVPAILFGDKSKLQKDTQALFSQAGIIHILAVSGLHVGMLYILVFRALFWIGNRPKAKHLRNFIALLVLLIYAWICGFSPSISRAVLMFAMIFTTRLFLKNSPTLHQLILSAFLLLLIEPLWLFQLGFQFSYLATAGIIIGLSGINQEKQKSKVLKFIWESSVVSFAAQGAVIPISLYYFKQIPIWFFLTNIPAFLLAFALLFLSLLFLLFSPFPDISNFIVYPIEWCTAGLYFLIEVIDLIPIRVLSLELNTVFSVFAIYFILYASFLFFTERAFGLLKWILVVLLIVLTIH